MQMTGAIKRVTLSMRARMPRFARNTFRLIRSVYEPPVSQQLPAELLADCRFCASRVDMLDYLPHGGVVAELGTKKGDFAREITTRTRPAELHLIDLNYAAFSDAGLGDAKLHQGDTVAVIGRFPNEHFDWIYVDAGHSYEAVITDARACASKVKPGGFLVFNDFAHIDPYLGRYGVHRAVVEFATSARWPFRLFAYQPAGLYDVALQRPV
jgi:SAM-dependent methyltransferase